VSEAPPTVAAVMASARALGVDRLDAQLLLARALACPRSWLLAHDDAVLGASQWIVLQADLTRRAGGEPLAYIVGEQEFHGLRLQVNPSVLVPRPDTEVLVDWALELLDAAAPEAARRKVVDLGTGSGAIALAVKHGCPGATVTATDASTAALDVARANARGLGLAIETLAGSWWEPLAGRRFDLILSNPPYIAGGDAHLAALRFEPTLALTPGGDGLDALRALTRDAAAHLEPGGWLLLEHGFDQHEAVQAMLREHAFADVQTRIDLGGQPRCTGGRR
jgi:release factor glutamine methyltransferase